VTTRLDRDRTLFLAVDLQERLLPKIRDADRILRNTELLLRLSGVLELPVLLTTQYRDGLGDVVEKVRAAAPGVAVLDKRSFGCFDNPEFEEALARFKGRDQLLVAGVESHICVAQTVLAALGKGYQIHVAGDAVGSRTEENWRTGLHRMETAGATLSSTEMAAYELLARSDSDAFKKMLPLFKDSA
jgi:hypothetical protein